MNERKSREEIAEELESRRGGVDDDLESHRHDPSDSDGLPKPDTPFEALSDEEQAEINDMFTLLHKNGYETAGGYQVTSEGPESGTVVTLSAILPSSNDWDPSQVYDDE